MRARAPGKLILSGAYSVLEGAAAIGVAVDRYAIADASRQAERDTDEMRCAVELGLLVRSAWFDASDLRLSGGTTSRKLGLGSSAAVLVAALASQARLEGTAAGAGDGEGLAAYVRPRALRAHRRAQPRGSGVDVVVACHGGVLCCRRDDGPEGIHFSRHRLPTGLLVRPFASTHAASTPAMLARVELLAREAPGTYRRCVDRAAMGAERTASAPDVEAFVAGLALQFEALTELGVAAGIAIVEPDVVAIGRKALEQGGVFGPAGAGGGDIVFYAGHEEPSAELVSLAASLGMRALDVEIGVPGVHGVGTVPHRPEAAR